MKVAYLGPKGSYSYFACSKFLEGDYIAKQNFTQVIQSLVGCEVDYAVVPIQNSLNGGVMQNLDLLQSNDVFAIAEYTLPISHCLLSKGDDIRKIKTIYSHSQAIEQCHNFLSTLKVDFVPVSSTSQAVALLKNEDEGAIASVENGKTLNILAQNIADEKNNFTRFLLLRRGKHEKEHSKQIYFSFTCKHEPGALLSVLGKLSNVNMTKIESRPIKEHTGEFRFFVEIDGDIMQKSIQDTLKNVAITAKEIKLLGAY